MTENEAQARIKINALLEDAGWNLSDGSSVLYEYKLPDDTQADYVLCDRRGRPVAVVEAKRGSTNPLEAEGQGRHYAEQLNVPFVFLSNGEEVRFLDRGYDAFARVTSGFFSQDDLERRIAVRDARRDISLIGVDRAIVDRDYQIECVEILSNEISAGKRNALIEMATGTGKTRVSVALISRLFEASSISRVLFLVDRIALANQAYEVFARFLPDYPTYVLRPNRNIDRAKNVIISTLQTMITDYQSFSKGYFDLVIIDECHRSIYGEYSNVLHHFDSIKIGMTATPCIADVVMYPNDEDDRIIRDTLKFFGLSKPTYRYQLRQAINDKYLVPYSIYKATTVKTSAKDGFEVKKSDLDWSSMDSKTRKEFEKLFGTQDSIMVDPRSLERKFTIPERNRAIAREFKNVVEQGYRDRSGVIRRPNLGKTIVFAVTKQHAETLAEMLDDMFSDKKDMPNVRFADYVVSDVGSGARVDVRDVIRRFKEENFPRILVSVNMLDTGFDCPEVENLVMARFTNSTILYQQMRGRGTRKAPHIGKSSFTIFDFVGVTDFHGDDDDSPDPSDPKRKSWRKRPSNSNLLLTLDVDDHIDPASRDWLVIDNDGRIVRSTEHEARSAILGMRIELWTSKQEFNSEQSRWARLIGSFMRADAMNVERLGEWDFDRHPFSTLGGYDQARRVFGGDDSVSKMIVDFNRSVFEQDEAGDNLSSM